MDESIMLLASSATVSILGLSLYLSTEGTMITAVAIGLQMIGVLLLLLFAWKMQAS